MADGGRQASFRVVDETVRRGHRPDASLALLGDRTVPYGNDGVMHSSSSGHSGGGIAVSFTDF
jgi:hypothetical protein